MSCLEDWDHIRWLEGAETSQTAWKNFRPLSYLKKKHSTTYGVVWKLYKKLQESSFPELSPILRWALGDTAVSESFLFFFFEKPFTPYFSNSSKIHWFSKLDFHKYLLWCGFSSLTGLSRHLFISHQASCLMTTSPQSGHIMCHVAASILDST